MILNEAAAIYCVVKVAEYLRGMIVGLYYAQHGSANTVVRATYVPSGKA